MKKPNLQKKMERTEFRFFTLMLFILVFPNLSIAQINVEGIDNLTFTKKAESYITQVTDTFNLHSMKVVPDGLSLSWDAGNLTFSLYGAATLIIAGDEVHVSIGSEENPGISIIDDALEEISFGITTKFGLKGITIIPDSLTMLWNQGENYDIWGEVDLDIEGDKIECLLGSRESPGMEIYEGDLQDFNIGITADFKLKSLEISPKQLTFEYKESDNSYGIRGEIDVKIENDSLNADLDGDGIRIIDGKIDHIDISIYEDFTLKSLSIKPKDLTFYYDRSEDDYNIHGSIEVDLEGDKIIAVLGDEENPGIEIKNGKLDKIDIGITEDFSLKELDFKTDSLGFSWQKEKENTYHLFGGVKIDLEDDEVGFSFGSMEDPGLVFVNGSIDSFKISTSDDLHFASLEVVTENLTLEHHEGEYHVSGKLYVNDLWSALIDLGEGPGSGVTLQHDHFQIEQAKFELGDIDLGPISVDNVTIKIDENRVAEGNLEITFPPGWEVDADLTFDYGQLDGVHVSWETKNIYEAIELPGTGCAITRIEADVRNIDDPHNFSLEGGLGMIIGGAFEIDGKAVSIVYIETDLFLDREELKIGSEIMVGAYMDDKGDWHPVIGDGDLEVDLKWGQSYTISGKLNVPAGDEAILTADFKARLANSGAFNALIKAHLKVPNDIPLIGGYEVAEADGAIHYAHDDPSSFAAGWLKVDLLFYTLKKGVRYNLHTKDISIIGSSQISNINKEVTTDEENDKGPYFSMHNVKVEGVMPNMVHVKVIFDKKYSNIGVYTTQPFHGFPGFFPGPSYFVKGVDKKDGDYVKLDMHQSSCLYVFEDVEEADFFILPHGYDKDIKARLADGSYVVYFSNNEKDNFIKEVQAHKIYDAPTNVSNYFDTGFYYRGKGTGLLSVEIYDLGVQFEVNGWVNDRRTATITYFISKDGKNGIPIQTIPFNDVFIEQSATYEYVTKTHFSIADKISFGDDLYMYAIVNDGVNAPIQSAIKKMDYSFSIKGQIKIQNEDDALASGINVNIEVKGSDNKWYNINGGLGVFTNSSGEFGFPNEIGNGVPMKLLLNIPYGYEVDPGSDYIPGTELISSSDKKWNIGTIILRKIQN